jgi:hypothetical protein
MSFRLLQSAAGLSIWLTPEGDPPDSLFAVPPDYVEMPPVELEAAYAEKYPGNTLYGQMVDLMQQRYEDSLLRKP